MESALGAKHTKQVLLMDLWKPQMSKLLGGAEDYGKEAGDVQKLGDSLWRFLTVEGKGLPLDGTLGGEEKGRWSGKIVVSGTENQTRYQETWLKTQLYRL